MRFSELNDRTVAVWGAGRETRSFASHLRDRLPNARITAVVLDDPTEAVDSAVFGDVDVIAAQDAGTALQSRCEVLVRSPGVSIHRPELRTLIDAGLTVTTATALWLAERQGRHVTGVTGTKGKSTTATIIAHLSAAMRPTHLAGNIGRPALDLLDVSDDEWVVLELSSYQIADLRTGPESIVITNLYREHIDWHGSEAVYRTDKLRLASLPGVRGCAYHPGTADVDRAVSRIPRRVTFGATDGWHVLSDGHDVAGVSRGESAPIRTDAFPLAGGHNLENLCAALAGLEAAGLELPPDLPDAFAGLTALPHRLQTVRDADEILWVDDSISTTPESTIAALAAYPDRPIVLIAGGLDREQDHSELARALTSRNATLVALPTTGLRLASDAASAGLNPSRISQVPDMEAAVNAARAQARPGSVVLLSPAAPSYNSYRNFEERGDHFASLSATEQ